MAGTTSFSDQTVRNVIFTSVGGSALRVRLSSSRTVTFGGRKTSTTIPAGAQEMRDPVAFTVQPETELAGSIYLPAVSAPPWAAARPASRTRASAGTGS